MHATNNSVWPWVCDEVQELNLPNALVLFIVYYMSQLTGLREAWPWRMICNNCTGHHMFIIPLKMTDVVCSFLLKPADDDAGNSEGWAGSW